MILRPALSFFRCVCVLPVTNRSSVQQRTKLCKKTLNPVWEEEFKFEVADDSVLQNEPIEFKVCIDKLASSQLVFCFFNITQIRHVTFQTGSGPRG